MKFMCNHATNAFGARRGIVFDISMQTEATFDISKIAFLRIFNASILVVHRKFCFSFSTEDRYIFLRSMSSFFVSSTSNFSSGSTVARFLEANAEDS